MEQKFIYARHGYISIPDYTLGESKLLENILSEYDEVYHRRIYHGLSYDETTRELRVPLGVGVNMVSRMTGRYAKSDYNADEPRHVKITLNVKPRNDMQENIIHYIVEKNKKYSQAAIVAGTGIGKTYCAIAISVCYSNATLIVSHSSKLRSHWSKKIQGYTDTIEDDILILDSSAKILKLLGSDKPISYRYISTTHAILASLAKHHGWYIIEEVCRRLGIGCIIIDEVHRCFANTVKILTHTNVKKYLLLTATFKRSERVQNRIFQTCFSSIPKYVQENVTGEKKQKHIIGTVIEYNSHPSLEAQLNCESNYKGGLNGIQYVNYLVDEDDYFYTVFSKFLDKCIEGTRPFKGKGMIMCGSIHACEQISEFLYNSLGSKLGIGVYNSKSGLSQKEKDKLLEISDIIVTTSGSLGEGTDMDNLHYVIDIESYRSEILSEQIPGRLRDLQDGHKFNYIKISNIGFVKAYDQLQDCIKMYSKNMEMVRIIKWKP